MQPNHHFDAKSTDELQTDPSVAIPCTTPLHYTTHSDDYQTLTLKSTILTFKNSLTAIEPPRTNEMKIFQALYCYIFIFKATHRKEKKCSRVALSKLSYAAISQLQEANLSISFHFIQILQRRFHHICMTLINRSS